MMPSYQELIERGTAVTNRQAKRLECLEWQAYRTASSTKRRFIRTLDRIGNIVEEVAHELLAPVASRATYRIRLMRGRHQTKSSLSRRH